MNDNRLYRNYTLLKRNRFFVFPFFALIFLLPSFLKAQEDARIDWPDTTQKAPDFYKNATSGEFTPSRGFDLYKSKYASLNFSFYGLVRWIDQLPSSTTFTDHLGRERRLDPRNDIHWHRYFLWLTGHLYTEKFRYNLSIWGLASTNQVLVFGNLQYMFHKSFRVGVGIGPNVGTRSVQGPWPYFMASDRQMIDDYVRPGFSGGLWITGEPFPKFNYTLMLGNALSQVGVASSQLTRDMVKSASVWWMPTTGEFGPRGGFDDFEIHQEVATRIGGCYTQSREDRYADISNPTPGNTQIRIPDGLYLFEAGALADGVTVKRATYQLLSVDLGVKYKGLAITSEIYWRRLSDFQASGELPIDEIYDQGFYVQASYPVIKKRLQVYGVYGYLFDEFERKPWEIAGGLNFYPSQNRNWRVNFHYIRMEKSPAGSFFGYYLPGQSGSTVSIGMDILM